MFPPNFSPDKLELLFSGMLESLQIAVLATAFGISLALPLGFAAARNMLPARLAWSARGLIALLRSFHPVIVAILFVKAVGFGALAGILALTVASIGFHFEAVHGSDRGNVDEARGSRARDRRAVLLGDDDGVLPQVFSRFIGFSPYQLDSNLRNSTMVGIVGAGGIGGDPVRRVPALRLRFRAARSCSRSS